METQLDDHITLLLKYSSYRTYEEWKQIRTTRITVAKTSSYRTYEEWKRLYRLLVVPEDAAFLPYL